MFTHGMAIEKRLERLMGTSYRLDIVDDEFMEKLQKQIVAECRGKLKENVYKRIEEQSTRDRMLEACGFKIEDLEDLSKRFGKRKKKIKRMMKAMPLILQKEKEVEERIMRLQKTSGEEQKEPQDRVESKAPLWYKVPRVNEMHDDKSVEELYRMADEIVWRRGLSEGIEIVKDTEEEAEEETKRPPIKEIISKAQTVESDATSEASSDDERSWDEEEEPKRKIIPDDSKVIDSGFADQNTSSARGAKKRSSKPPETDTTFPGAREIASLIGAVFSDSEEQYEEGSSIEIASVETEEETEIEPFMVSEETAVHEKGELITASIEGDIAAAANEEDVAAVSTEGMDVALQESTEELIPEERTVTTPHEEASEVSLEAVPDVTPESTSTSECEQFQPAAELDISTEKIPPVIVEMITNKQTIDEDVEDRMERLPIEAMKQGMSSFDTILSMRTKDEHHTGEQKSKIEDLVIEAVRESASLDAAGMAHIISTVVDTRNEADEAETTSNLQGYTEEKADNQSEGGNNSEKEYLPNEPNHGTEENKSETILGSPEENLQQHDQAAVIGMDATETQDEDSEED